MSKLQEVFMTFVDMQVATGCEFGNLLPRACYGGKKTEATMDPCLTFMEVLPMWGYLRSGPGNIRHGRLPLTWVPVSGGTPEAGTLHSCHNPGPRCDMAFLSQLHGCSCENRTRESASAFGPASPVRRAAFWPSKQRCVAHRSSVFLSG